MASCTICSNPFTGTPWKYEADTGTRVHVDCSQQAPAKPALRVGDVGASTPVTFHVPLDQVLRSKKERRREPTVERPKKKKNGNRGNRGPGIVAKFDGTCPVCGRRFDKGTRLSKCPGGGWGHTGCSGQRKPGRERRK